MNECRGHRLRSRTPLAALALLVTVATVAPPPAGASGRIEPPRIHVSSPSPEARLVTDTVEVTAVVTDEAGLARIRLTVNGAPVAAVTAPAPAAPTIEIATPVPLVLGQNVIMITATNTSGRTAQVIRRVHRVAPVPVAPAPPAPPKAGRLAVVIGVDAYDNHLIPPVPFARNDAEAVYDFLVNAGGYRKDDVKLLTDRAGEQPTLGNIKRALGAWLPARAARTDTVFVYYAGRGATEGASRFLIPRDADPESLFVTAFAMDDLAVIARRLPSERVVFAIDACFSGSAGAGRTVTISRPPPRARTDPPDDLLELVHRQGAVDGNAVARELKLSPETARMRLGRATAEGSLDRRGPEYTLTARGRRRIVLSPGSPADVFGRNGAVLSASGPSESCLELGQEGHGLFTYYLLKGLKGEAKTERDGVVTIRELFGYVQAGVVARARQHDRRQSPVMSGGRPDLPFIEIQR